MKPWGSNLRRRREPRWSGGLCRLLCGLQRPPTSSGSFFSLMLREIQYGRFLKQRVVGIHVLQAPVLHPMSEGLFNFVIGWTFMFAPLLFTDRRRDRYGGSLDILWGFQMFLTNTFLIPYMAIRLNDVDRKYPLKKPYQLVSLMSKGAPFVGIIGGVVCLISALWAIYGRADGGYGELAYRLEFLGRYLGSERLAYAFVWDIILYAIFQPWLIGDNLQNVKEGTLGVVKTLRFIPVVGLITYLLCLEDDEKFWLGLNPDRGQDGSILID